MPLFTKNADGEYVEVDEHEFVKSTDEYSKLLEESIDRRKKIAELKAKLAEKETEEPVTPPVTEKPTEPPPSPTTPPLDVDGLYEEFRKRLELEKLEKERKELERRENLAKLAKDKGLGERVLPILEKSSNPEETANLLLQSGFRFDNASGGTTGGGNPSAVDMDKVLKQMGIGVK